MANVENRLRESFRLVKTDILRIQEKLTQLANQQENILELMNKNTEKRNKISQEVTDIKRKISLKKKTVKVSVKNAPKKTIKRFVASKTGNKFHIEQCPYAKQIKPKQRRYFNSKIKPLNEGLKPCNCVRKI